MMLDKMKELKGVYDAQGVVLSIVVEHDNHYARRVLFRLDRKMYAMDSSLAPAPVEPSKKSLNEMVFGKEGK
jgi:hypothetical protein